VTASDRGKAAPDAYQEYIARKRKAGAAPARAVKSSSANTRKKGGFGFGSLLVAVWIIAVIVLVANHGNSSGKSSGASPHSPSAPHHHSSPIASGPSKQQLEIYRTEYNVCQGITKRDINRDYGYSMNETAEDMILRMEQATYGTLGLDSWGYEGCLDAYYGQPMRKNP
jgi:hypothetical protein